MKQWTEIHSLKKRHTVEKALSVFRFCSTAGVEIHPAYSEYEPRTHTSQVLQTHPAALTLISAPESAERSLKPVGGLPWGM